MAKVSAEFTEPQIVKLDELIAEYLEGIENWKRDHSLSNSCISGAYVLPPDECQRPDASDINDAIKMAVGSRVHNAKLIAPNPNDRRLTGKCHGHQRRIPNSAYSILTKQLLETAEKFKAASNFDDIHCIVDKEVGNVSGAGELMAYDVALRIGLWKGGAHEPKTVYLHATPLKSAKLMFGPKVRGPLSIDTFPEPFKKLKPLEIENFLCVCHKPIAELFSA